MKTRSLLLAAVALALAAPHPADAVLKRYRTTGTIEIITPTEGTTFQHQTRTKNCNELPQGRGVGVNQVEKFSCPEATLDIDNDGTPEDCSNAFSANACWVAPGESVMLIDDPGTGTPTLQEYTIRTVQGRQFGSSALNGVPGSYCTTQSDTTITLGAPTAGSGSTTTTITWGPLSGFVSTGGTYSETTPGPPSPTGCIGLVPSPGTAPPPAILGSFATDGWVFTPDGTQAETPKFLVSALVGGLVLISHDLELTLAGNQIPALPLAGVAGLGLGLAYLGARAVRSRK